MYFKTQYESPVGMLTLVSNDEKIIGVWIAGQKCFPGSLNGLVREKEEHPVLVQTGEWLDRYFKGEKPDIAELPLAPEGSEFRRKVWQLLCEIPYGEVTTYGELAKRMAVFQGKERMSAQAIGGAVGHNPISIIIPCHRVVGADGSLTGYAGGMDVKIKLLEHEQVDLTKMYVPERGSVGVVKTIRWNSGGTEDFGKIGEV